ncbi:MAG TPA: hypothetical protein VMS71_03440 [Candidatus Acidoferrum sp.]|nr:hypothetical protein [Candidatus Acidoferrum sp.]
MKKFLLALVLLAVIVVISIVRSTRDREDRQKLYKEGLDTGAAQAEVYRQRFDSLSGAVEQQKAHFADSLGRVSQSQNQLTDSLRGELARKDQALSQATAKKRVSAAKPPVKPRSTDSLDTSGKHAQLILSYYRKRLESLPKDLSDYEKKVALNEVREETAKKFSITETDLEKIRLANNLTE